MRTLETLGSRAAEKGRRSREEGEVEKEQTQP